ncbi:hypothetical protein MASR1M31_06550 [Porphyromonadaceae bacterium]
MSTSLYGLFRGEVFKTKRELGLYLMLFFPVAIFLFAIGHSLLFGSTDLSEYYSHNPWIVMYERYLWIFYVTLFPMAIAMFCYSLFDVEYKNDYLKKLFTLPVSSSAIFGAKVLYVVTISFVSALTTWLLMQVSAFVLEKVYFVYPFSEYDYSFHNFLLFVRLFFSILSIASFLLLLSTSFKTYVVPIGIAVAGALFTFITQGTGFVIYSPFYSIIASISKYFKGDADLVGKVEIINMCYIVVFMMLSYCRFVTLKSHEYKK